MLADSGPGLVELLGLPLQDDRVAAALLEMRAPDPDPEPGVAVAVTVAIPAIGLDIRFQPPMELRDGDSFGVPADTLLTGLLFFHGVDSTSPPFPGELPFGLSLDQTKTEVRATLDPLVGPDDGGGPAWEFDGLNVRVYYTADQHIKLLAVGLIWSGETAFRPHDLPPRPNRATAALLRDIAAHPDLTATHATPDGPPELAVLLRHADDPLLTDEVWIEITENPPTVEGYLEGPKAAGTARFFRDIRWIGQDDDGKAFGYWKAGAGTFDGAPVVRLDTEGTCELYGLTFVDVLDEFLEDEPEALAGFLARTGLPAPTPEDARLAALSELPDPDRAFDAWLALDPEPWPGD
jgi:hypothetical protein